MERLLASGLYRTGLIKVQNQTLVDRYNSCLLRLGIEPTRLSCFRVDGMGWSPEIAEEKNCALYLCAGVANAFAIIISPEQCYAPLHFPLNSYEDRILQDYYARFAYEIADITTSAGISLVLEEGLSSYSSPRDLLMIKEAAVNSSAGALDEAVGEQRRLLESFWGDDLAWLDPKLRERLAASAKEHGDLRKRKLHIPKVKFDQIESFYCRAFGGVFILRGSGTGQAIIVLDNPEFTELAHTGPRSGRKLHDPDLPAELLRNGYLSSDLPWYSVHLDQLEQKLEMLQAHILCSAFPNQDYLSLSPGARLSKAAELGTKLPPMLHELECLIMRRENLTLYDASNELQHYLLRPAKTLPKDASKVVCQLLTRWQAPDVLQMYAADKEFFYQQYQSWSKAKRTWALEYILKNSPKLRNSGRQDTHAH